MAKAEPRKPVCPNCAGAGYLFVAGRNGKDVHVLCGHSVCQAAMVDRIAARVESTLTTWIAGREARCVREVTMSLPEFIPSLVREVVRRMPLNLVATQKRP